MVTYLRQDPTTNLMIPVEGVQVQPATQGQPVEVSAGGRIDPSLLPTTYDPKVDVIAAEAVQAGDLCYLLWENNARVIRKAVATAMATLSTVFVKDSYAQGASAAAYIHGVMTLVNPGTYTAADVGTSIYLSPTIPGYFQKSYPTASGQYTQRVAVITDVTESTLSCFFIGYLDRGRSAGAGLVDTDPTVTAHLTDHNNPHQVTAEQLGALVPSQIGAAGGIAPLGSNSMVPEANLPLSMWKAKSVRAVVTSNVNLAAPGATLDGLAMTAGDRVLLTNQTDLGAPGVYVWNSAATPMTRATDADTAAMLCESIWLITEGTQAHSVWMNTNKTIPTLGSTLLTFVRILDPGWTNPLTTSGDLLMATTGGAASRLAAGANGLVLTMVAGLPKWSELSVSGMTNPMTTAGDLIVGGTDGAAERLAKGTAGQVLTMSNGAPAWAAATGGGSIWSNVYAAQVTTDSPVAWWRFNDDFGASTWADSVGSLAITPSSATWLPAPGLLVGDANRGVSLSGHYGTFPSIAWPNGDFSVEAVVSASKSQAYGVVFSISDSSSNAYVNGVALQFATAASNDMCPAVVIGNSVGTPTVVGAPTSWPIGVPLHLCGTYEASTRLLSLYLNGSLVNSTTLTFDPATTIRAYRYVGTSGNNLIEGVFEGVLDELALYNSCLSAARVAQHFRYSRGGQS